MTAIRLLVADATPLSPDEAYYWVWSRALAPSYLDHPPMVALWIWLGTALAGHSALGVRLLAPLSAAGGSIFLARAGEALFPSSGAGVRAAVLLNATLMVGAGAVTMTPDTPLLFFWTVAVWALARIATGGGGAWWLVAGTAAGLALDSKYTAALLGVGIAIWLVTRAGRTWIRTPWPWAGGAIAGVLFLPIVLWNADHGWASFIRQGGRAGDWAPSRALADLTELIGGQIGLATPLIFVLFVAGTGLAVRRWREPRWALLAALVLPGTAVFVQHAFGDRVQANWVSILYPGAALAASGATRWMGPAAITGFACTALVYLQASLSVLPLPPKLDPTMRLAGWDQLAQQATAKARALNAAYLASEAYGTASLLAWQAAGLPVLAVEPRWRFFDLPAAAQSGQGLLLLSNRRREAPDPALWQSAEPVAKLTRSRGSTEAETFRLYLVVLRPDAPAVLVSGK